VDYVIEQYGNILEIVMSVADAEELKRLTNSVFLLEMLHNMLVVYVSQLRENPNNFYSLVRKLPSREWETP